MVCEKCEKKLAKVIVPDKWKEGAHNTTEGGGRKINENKLLSKKNSCRDGCNGFHFGHFIMTLVMCYNKLIIYLGEASLHSLHARYGRHMDLEVPSALYVSNKCIKMENIAIPVLTAKVLVCVNPVIVSL
ncbi:hypothetical protein DM860_003612 [Cuscuta australis]|uniref:Cysteine-rich PDZ-binding protein n=1 Tax=Cuscuta australis TaxID=267555 RepID=A0A328DLG1_9ASTE|nr:hypothetical protein DM860_003612 [Cuscuta australis]